MHCKQFYLLLLIFEYSLSVLTTELKSTLEVSIVYCNFQFFTTAVEILGSMRNAILLVLHLKK